jgi:hypothetical protein
VLRARIIAGIAAIVALGSVSTWIFAAESRGSLPPGDYVAVEPGNWLLTGSDAALHRRDVLQRAGVRLSIPGTITLARSGVDTSATPAGPLVCRFLSDEPTGTSAKFNCVLDGGAIIKVKYNRNSEIHAEAAASILLEALGFAADHVRIVPWLRCYGCPRYPFLTTQLLSLARATDVLTPHGYENAYTDFERVAVEDRFDAPAIETESHQGWAWFELPSHASQADHDAFRLLATFLAHWDNKAENQRLVCLDGPQPPSTERCARPLLMIQDLGATFGPTKANLAEWNGRPIWADRGECLVSMRALPYKGATFPDARIREEGRAQLARQLAAIPDDDVRKLFADARFHEFYSGTDDDKDLDRWTAAFRYRADQILHAGPCPSPPPGSSID